jgi:hypothetical protein
MLRKDIFPLYKKDTMNCGEACIYSIVKGLNLKNNITYKNCYWITDIAYILLKELGLKINLFCYESSLFKDYNMNPENKFSGFNSIRN